MDWKNYFKFRVYKETLDGSHLYFQAELKMLDNFDLEELSLTEFDYLNLSEGEKKVLSLSLRKILLRCHYFKSLEFQRIILNFAERIDHEDRQLLTFSTSGGGTYLFTGLLQYTPLVLGEKRIICYTNELPLKIKGLYPDSNQSIHFIPHLPIRTWFRNMPSLTVPLE